MEIYMVLPSAGLPTFKRCRKSGWGSFRGLYPPQVRQAPSSIICVGLKPPTHIDVNNVARSHDILMDFWLCPLVIHLFLYIT